MYNEYELRAKEILSTLTLEEKVGQMFIGRCPGNGKDDRGIADRDIEEYKLGGYTLFAYDFEGKTPETIKENISRWQSKSKIPMLFAVDCEGGRVVRVSMFPEYGHAPFRYPSEIFKSGGYEEADRDTRDKAAFLKALGINVNYAPVCDMASSPENFIFHRTVGLDAAGTAKYISTVVRAMNEEGLIGSLKHFPGYGDNVDTHQLIAHDARPLSDFLDRDLMPFTAGIDAGAPIVMVAHNTVECLDASLPASLSPASHTFLRERLGFDGVIMTDSLDMKAITLFAPDGYAAVLAVKAGNDLLCCSTHEKQIPAVLTAVKNGEIGEDRIDESVMRLLKLKLKYGIIS